LLRTVNRPGRAVEGRVETVARGVVLVPPPCHKRIPNELVVSVDELLPAPIPEAGLLSRRVDDVGEEDRGENGVRDDRPGLKTDETCHRLKTRKVDGVDLRTARHPSLLGENLDPRVRHQRRDMLRYCDALGLSL